MALSNNRRVLGAQKLAKRIQTIRENLNLPEMVDSIGELLLRRTKNRFDTETDPTGKRWTPLKASTLARRRRNGSSSEKILQDTKAMKDSIKVIRGGVGTAYTNTGAGIRIGIDDPDIAAYARLHQLGKSVKKRRFLGVGAADVKAVDGLLRRKAAQLETL